MHLFYIKDVTERGDVSVEYCPTGEMWADVLKKPLKGTALNKMRARVMNCPMEYAETVFKDIDKISGLHKTDFYPFP